MRKELLIYLIAGVLLATYFVPSAVGTVPGKIQANIQLMSADISGAQTQVNARVTFSMAGQYMTNTSRIVGTSIQDCLHHLAQPTAVTGNGSVLYSAVDNFMTDYTYMYVLNSAINSSGPKSADGDGPNFATISLSLVGAYLNITVAIPTGDVTGCELLADEGGSVTPQLSSTGSGTSVLGDTDIFSFVYQVLVNTNTYEFKGLQSGWLYGEPAFLDITIDPLATVNGPFTEIIANQPIGFLVDEGLPVSGSVNNGTSLQDVHINVNDSSNAMSTSNSSAYSYSDESLVVGNTTVINNIYVITPDFWSQALNSTVNWATIEPYALIGVSVGIIGVFMVIIWAIKQPANIKMQHNMTSSASKSRSKSAAFQQLAQKYPHLNNSGKHPLGGTQPPVNK